MDADAQRSGRRRRGLTRPAALLAIACVVALLGLLAYGISSRAPNTAIDARLAQGRPAAAPDFKLQVLQAGSLGARLSRRLAPTLTRRELDLRALRGAPVVLNFWASWCPPCRTEAPLLEHSWRGAREHGVLFVGLNMQDVTTDARDFMRAYGVDFLNLRDPPGDQARRWGVTGLPETFFLSARGSVVGHVIGALSAQQLARGVALATSGRALAAQVGGAEQPTR